MKIIILFILILYSGSFYPQMNNTQNYKGTVLIGKQYPEFAEVSLNGDSISSEILKGKITFINFWFGGCAPCIAEIDNLKSLFFKFTDNPNFQFLSFTRDIPEYALQMQKKYDLPFNIYSVEDRCYSLNFNSGFPTIFIIDNASRIIYYKRGGSLDKKEIEEDFDIMEQIIENLLYPNK